MTSPPASPSSDTIKESEEPDLQSKELVEHAVPDKDHGKVMVKAVVDEKKKKKKKKTSGKKKATGFEEYFCEPPMTPAEHEEEKTVIYPPHRSFVDRIEDCIQRYRARRRLDPERERLFSQYLTLGGIDATVRQFQSSAKIGPETLEDSSKTAIREMIADDVIHRGDEDPSCSRFYNPNFPEHWEVDFTGIASGFLSEHLVSTVGYDIEMIARAADVVGNFLKYVTHHDVCPEYEQDISSALDVCERAVEESASILAIWDRLPSHFATCLRVLKCEGDDEQDSISAEGVSETVTHPHAVNTVAAVASILVPELAKAAAAQHDWKVVDTSSHSFEICKINLPDDAAKAKLQAINLYSPKYPNIEACGTFTANWITIEDGWDRPPLRSSIPLRVPEEIEFVVEESILSLLKVGMKLTLEVCTTSVGWRFIKSFKDIKPSYYTFLPQELMAGFKQPILSERPGPSVHDDQDEFNINEVPMGNLDED